MRCTNCGWDNPEGCSKCEKCKSSLATTSSQGYQGYSDTQREAPPNFVRGNSSAQGMEKTIRENVSIGLQSNSCKKCGYLLATGARSCPSCGAKVEAFDSQQKSVPMIQCPKCKSQNQIGSKFCSNCGTSFDMTNNRIVNESNTKKNVVDVDLTQETDVPNKFTGTLRPGIGGFSPNIPSGMNIGQNRMFFTLKPIAWEGEGIDYQPISYSGIEVILNRANTDANNQSITSKQQALLTHDKDGWYIENKSELQTTYIRVGKKIKLEDGDIILLGNRFFEFKGK